MKITDRVREEGQRLRREHRDWGVIAFAGYAAIAFAILAILAYLLLPSALLTGEGFKSDAERAKALNDARGSLLQLLGGLLVLAGAYLTARTVRLNRAGHISDRFSKGVEQLGHDKTPTRVGGIYALERVMRDAPFEQRAVIETLVAFMRETCSKAHPSAKASTARRAARRVRAARPVPGASTHPPADVAAALRVIGRRNIKNDPPSIENYGWNLTELDLRDFSLRAGNFTGVNLWRADLSRANLTGADLRGATGVADATLTGAVFDDATRFPQGFKADTQGLRRAGASAAAPGEPRA